MSVQSLYNCQSHSYNRKPLWCATNVNNKTKKNDTYCITIRPMLHHNQAHIASQKSLNNNRIRYMEHRKWCRKRHTDTQKAICRLYFMISFCNIFLPKTQYLCYRKWKIVSPNSRPYVLMSLCLKKSFLCPQKPVPLYLWKRTNDSFSLCRG